MRFKYFTLTLLLISGLASCKFTTSNYLSSTKSDSFEKAAVVTAHPEASKIGIEILKAGGNAVDAAVAVQFALAVSFPVAGNIGGGGFMVYRGADGEVSTLDFREKAPLSSTETMYQDDDGNVISDLSKAGHLAVGVPGSVEGMYSAFTKYSKLKDWKKLVQPSIDLARDGFKITPAEAGRLNEYKKYFIKENTLSNVFNSDKEWMPNDRLIQENLAKVFERIRDEGPAGFYEGETARLLVNEMKRGNGIITFDDLKAYKSVWREPIICEYDDLKIVSMPPPSSGGIALCQLLEIIEPYDIEKLGFQSKEAVHLMVEAERRAYADRTKHLGDADFYPVPVENLLDKDYLKSRMASFDKSQASKSDDIQEGEFGKESEQTTHFSIVDEEGNAVSITTTLNTGYGSKVVVGGAGFFLNNEMDDFSAKPGVPNFYGLLGAEANKIEAEKRMLSSMTPTIVEKNGKLKLVVGTPGGSTIITSVYQVILNSLEFGLTLKESVHEERFHHQWKPEEVYYEKGCFTDAQLAELDRMGHTMKERGSIGRVEAILIDDNGKIQAVADRRGDDDARGY